MLEKMFELIAKSGLFKPILSLSMLSAVILFWPELLVSIGMEENYINEYKNITILIFGFSFLMVLFTVIHESYKKYTNYKNSDKQVALRYLNKSLTQDQQEFINEKFFDKEKNQYVQFSKIFRLDGRGNELEKNKVVKKVDENIDYNEFSYNLLSYSLEFFNNKRKP